MVLEVSGVDEIYIKKLDHTIVSLGSVGVIEGGYSEDFGHIFRNGWHFYFMMCAFVLIKDIKIQ